MKAPFGNGMLQVGVPVKSPEGVLDKVNIVSVGSNPELVTITEVLGGPDVGFAVILGEVPVTVNVALPTSPAGLPVT